jgi:hypothetical protein
MSHWSRVYESVVERFMYCKFVVHIFCTSLPGSFHLSLMVLFRYRSFRSTMHVSGQQLQLVSGVAAILRYPMPDLVSRYPFDI